MRPVAALVVAALVCGAAAGSTAPIVRALPDAPRLTLRGTGFSASERLALKVVAVRTTTARLDAGRGGAFTRRVLMPGGAPCVVWRATVTRQDGRRLVRRGPGVDCRPSSGLIDSEPLRGTGVEGVVLFADVGPAPGVDVEVVSNGVALVRLETGADGRFAAYVPPGVYTVRAPSRTGPAARVTVVEGRLSSVSLTVDPRGR
jgi:hypothetical protein